MKTLLLTLALSAVCGSIWALPAPTPAPYRAFCKTMWLFDANCSDISIVLVKQIQSFAPEIGCEMCHYTLVSVTPQYIMANHTSPDGLYTEMISIAFFPTMVPGGCRASAVSQSVLFSASLLDNGVNYCNLHNLVTASGLSSQPDFLEMTNEWACLSVGLATCGM
ncbi:unnamed protein product [Knipowitschia caucasica]|uniref:Uncharacterized protein n=1 Tax=Knipowitschia caucasica TaxID=637954 RepID=A0AAV2JUI2_KNICA